MHATPPTPQSSLWALATGHFAPRCIHILAELGVADMLGSTAVTAQKLAVAAGLDPDALERVMRLAADHGVFAKCRDGWVHTPSSELLRSDHPQSLRAFVRFIGGDIGWRAAGLLAHTARTGETAVRAIVPSGIWDYFRDHPEEGRLFDEAMSAKGHGEIEALVPIIDAARFERIADIGGGRGHLLSALLDAAPRVSGVLFDLPAVLVSAVEHPRMTLAPGDFFQDPLPQADAYILANVLHDWPDDQANAILRRLRAAIRGSGEVLIAEALLPDGLGPDPATVLDLVMLTLSGGRERTALEYASLAAAGGFRLDRVVRTTQPISLMLAKPEMYGGNAYSPLPDQRCRLELNPAGKLPTSSTAI
jgi:SAM-dependent methyltransferase